MAAAAALGIACTVAPRPVAKPPAAVCDEACRSSLALVGPRGAYCGAVAIAPHVAITAGHCIEAGLRDGEAITLVAFDGRVITSRPHLVDLEGDIGTLVTRDLLPAHVRIAEPETGAGFTVRPFRGWRRTLTLVGGLEIDHAIFTAIDHGDSGSGVFDWRGRLIGVIVTCDLVSAEDLTCDPLQGGRYVPADVGRLAVVARTLQEIM